jgi:hypothetical protein
MNSESIKEAAYDEWIAASDACTSAEFALLMARPRDKAAAEVAVRLLWAVADAAHDAWIAA